MRLSDAEIPTDAIDNRKRKRSSLSRRRVLQIGTLISVLLMVILRLYALDSDPYPRLSWSTGLLTDEGFYIHNARNQVLFGAARTDEFNNMLVMPLLHQVQIVVFRVFGVGSISARLISVAASLLSLPLFFFGMRRVFGLRVATAGALFLGLDHLPLLYTRMALMDPFAEAVLVCAFYTFTRTLPEGNALGESEQSRSVFAWAFLTGLLLIGVYCIRTLGILAILAVLPTLLVAGVRTSSFRRWIRFGGFLSGLIIGGTIYYFVWNLPHSAELNHYS